MSELINAFEWKDLDSTLKPLKNIGKIRYIPNIGNAGDGLIAAATWQLFERLDLLSSIEVGGNISTGDIVIYAGGGNLVPEYDQAKKILEECLRVNVSKFILLPHSIRGNENLLRKLDQRFYIFCREQESYDHVQKISINAHVFLTHDLVFGLNRKLLNENLSINALRLRLIFHPELWRSYINWQLALLKIQPQHNRVMQLMRSDVESKYTNKYPSMFDLSSKHSSFYSKRLEADLVSRDFLSVLDRADHIISDRLHVCIGAVLLGKKVTILDNSYGKNRSVFLNSIQGNFSNVTFKSE